MLLTELFNECAGIITAPDVNKAPTATKHKADRLDKATNYNRKKNESK